MKKIGLIYVCVCLVILLAGCDVLGLQNPQPVRVTTPQAGDVLQIGMNFNVKAAIATNYLVSAAEIVLWDVQSNNKYQWLVNNPTPSRTLVVSQTFQVPNQAAPGGDYRLQVNAIKNGGADGVVGFSVPVRVAP